MQGFDASNVFPSEAQMMKIGWFSRLPKELPARAMVQPITAGIGIAILLTMTGIAVAQAQQAAPEATQDGYVIHQTADLGGHMVGLVGSGRMYDTLVNIQSGPRVLGETFTLRAVEGTKHPLLDDLSAFSSGFGGDPNNFAKLDFSKGKLYEFSGMFRRDRQYADYDLLGAPDNSGQKIPYGMVAGVPTTAYLAWGQNNDSPVMFNTVRRMTDTNLTILPLSKVTFRVGYSQNIFQGPTLSPARSVGKYDSLAVEYQRNSTDDFTGAMDWKPLPQTKITFEEVVDHYKTGSYFTLNPNGFQAQEADGTPVSLGDWDFVAITATATAPYTISACNATGTGASMGSAYTNSTNYTILTAPQTPGGLPIVNPACDVITSYLRSQPTRTITPTEMLRFQSSSIRNVAMNGDFRFTMADTSLPNYYENWTGLDGVIRSSTLTGNAKAKRQVLGIDYGLTWQATKTFALSEQIDYSNAHQPGSVTLAGSTLNTPATAGNETLNYAGTLTTGAAFSVTGNTIGTANAYFGQSFLTNNVTGTWDASPRATLALTYRYRTHVIALGFPHNVPSTGSSDTGSASPAGGTVTINENGGIFNVALRPTNQWDLNGTVEIAYADNVYTPIAPRQTKHYRVHTLYRPKPWATLSGTFNDVEHHNNTNNVVGTPTPDGPLQHVDYSRSASLGAVLTPNEHVGFDFNYAYTDVYTATNICYFSAASTIFPGAAETNSAGTGPNLCPNTLTDWGPVKDFMDAPTQSASFGLTYTPNKILRSGLGYRISAVSGNQFFSDAQQVNGSLQSAYQSPYVNLAWTVHPGLIWRADYNFYGYGEGGPSGAPFCSTATAATATVVPCNSSTLTGPTGLTESPAGMSSPRNFHANNVTLSIHYEF
jgi:hypothetical protein